AVALVRAQNVSECVVGTNVLGRLGDQIFEQSLGVIDPVERVQRKRLLDLHVKPKRRVLLDLVEGLHLKVVFLGAFISLGERRVREREGRVNVEGELQEDDAHVEAALTGERVADAVKRLGEAVSGSLDEKWRRLAAFDIDEQRLGKRM